MARPKWMKEEVWDALPLYVMPRVYLEDRTLSSILDQRGGQVCKVLELAWLGNRRSVSCIPEDTYYVTYSAPVLKDDPNTPIDESGGRIERNYEHYIVHDVKDRSGILIHRGRTPEWSKGCLTVGKRFGNYNTDHPTLEDSAVQLQTMIETLPKKFRLMIESKSGIPYQK